MKKNRLFILVLIALLAISAAACERTASTPAAASETPSGAFPLPNTQQAMQLLESYATQTAMAMEGSSQQPEDTSPETTPGAVIQPTAAPQTGNSANPTAKPTKKPEPQVQGTFEVPALYTLQEGEFPFCLARRFDVHPEDLLASNSLDQTTLVAPGTLLNIPQNGRPFPAQRALRPHPTTYVVSGDETIYAIACSFGDVDPRAIAQANNLSDPYTVSDGQTLSIP